MLDLDIAVIEADLLPYSAGPTILFKLRLANENPGEQIHSVHLRAQVRIEATERSYDAGEEKRLRDLFGEPRMWDKSLGSLLWTHANLIAPGFDRAAVVEMPIGFTYDFEVVAARYLCALENGALPLLFLFSGAIFFSEAGGPLQVAQIPWEQESRFRMPVRLWKETIDHYFPGTAWLRLRQGSFDRLYEYRVARGLPTWEAALDELLAAQTNRKES